MTVQLSPYLSFDGNAREAIEFYGTVFGAPADISTYESVGPVDDPAMADKVMHSQVDVPAVGAVMASDVPPGMPVSVNSSISLSGGPQESEQLHAWFAALSDGGTNAMPIETAPWGDEFGMVTDRFGVVWMVNVAGSAPQA
jgi:PhnB protein